jgi:hypothetical protein
MPIHARYKSRAVSRGGFWACTVSRGGF